MFATVLLALGLLPALAQTQWQLRTEKDGIKVYSSDVADSKIKAIKVIGEFYATPAQLAAVVMDVNTATDWVYHLKSSTLIKKVSSNEIYYYAEVNLPWPAANRDFVAHLIATQNPQTKAITIDGPAVPGYVPVKKGLVRIDNSVGKWIITPIGPDEVRVEYSIHVDPGGSLPSWLVNMFADQAPVQIFKNLKNELHKPVYRSGDNLLSTNIGN
ncbi:MAG: START domain-containing protein [Mucilaginibacter sp.]